MAHVRCINADNWFGTVGKMYKIIAEGTRVSKDIRFEGDNYIWEFVEVYDDMGQLVEIPSIHFEQE